MPFSFFCFSFRADSYFLLLICRHADFHTPFYILGVQLLALALYLSYKWYEEHRVYQWIGSDQKDTEIPFWGRLNFAQSSMKNIWS